MPIIKIEGAMVSRLGLPLDMSAVAVSSTLGGGGAGAGSSDAICDKRGPTTVPRGVASMWDCRGGASAADRFSSAAFSWSPSFTPMGKGISMCQPVKNSGLCHFGWSSSDWERHAERCLCKGPHGLRTSASSSRGRWTSSDGLSMHGVRGAPCSASLSPATGAADLLDAAGAGVGAVFSTSGDRDKSGGVGPAAMAPKTRTRKSPKAINLEGWLEESLAEIVKNLRDAPFLQFVFDSSSSCDTPVQEVRSVRHQVPNDFFHDPDKWASTDDTVARLSGRADGMILVHKLRQETLANAYGTRSTEGTVTEVAPGDEVQVDSSDIDQPHSGMPIQRAEKWRPCSSKSSGGDLMCARMPRKEGMQAEGCEGAGIGSSSTDIWGLVVQGRESKHHACYILRTTRVVGESGTCTRFSVVRAKCFGPSLHMQLENSWLM